jgi:hypothetical protein
MSPTLRLAIVTERIEYLGQWAAPTVPALLVSFVYWETFRRFRSRVAYRDWVLDSGAFSAYHSGNPISLTKYIDQCRELMATDPTLTEIYALDVIGDWRASLRNTELMWKAGIRAIPTYHFGEPTDALRGIARDYPKIALGGIAGLHGSKKLNWLRRCMDLVWPKKVHGFGCCDQALVMGVPLHSMDATSWETGPFRFGRWHQFGRLPGAGKKYNIRSQVQHFLEMERRARVRWAKEMGELEAAA